MAEAPKRSVKQAREALEVPLEEPAFDSGSFADEPSEAEDEGGPSFESSDAASSPPPPSDVRKGSEAPPTPPPSARNQESPQDDEIFRRLNGSGLAALRAASSIATFVGSDVVHMEHLLAGLFDESGGPVRDAITAAVTPDEFRALLERAAQSRIPPRGVYPTVEIHGMPPLSSHARQAILFARRLADSEQSDIRGRHLFSGAMSVEDCDPVRELLAAGVSRSVSPNDDSAISPPPPPSLS